MTKKRREPRTLEDLEPYTPPPDDLLWVTPITPKTVEEMDAETQHIREESKWLESEIQRLEEDTARTQIEIAKIRAETATIEAETAAMLARRRKYRLKARILIFAVCVVLTIIALVGLLS